MPQAPLKAPPLNTTILLGIWTSAHELGDNSQITAWSKVSEWGE